MSYQQQPIGTAYYNTSGGGSEGFDDMFDSKSYRYQTSMANARPAQWPKSTSEMRGHVVTSYEGMHEGSPHGGSTAIATQIAQKPYYLHGVMHSPAEAGKMSLGPRSFGGWDNQSSH